MYIHVTCPADTEILGSVLLGYDAVKIEESPQKFLHLVVMEGLVRLCGPQSNAGGRSTTSRATHAGKVKG
jgi:hypothetical protein